MSKPTIEYIPRTDDFYVRLPDSEILATRMNTGETLDFIEDIERALEERWNARVLQDVEDGLRDRE